MSNEELRERVAVVEAELEDARADIQRIFGKLDSAATDLQKVTKTLSDMNVALGKYTVYNKVLWPIVTLLVAGLSFFVGVKIL